MALGMGVAHRVAMPLEGLAVRGFHDVEDFGGKGLLVLGADLDGRVIAQVFAQIISSQGDRNKKQLNICFRISVDI